jgi:hypothetical protein
MINRVFEVLPQAAVPLCTLFGLIAAGLLASVLAALRRDALDMAEATDLRRLTAKLPQDLRPGRHHLDRAPGTTAQRRLWESDTEVFDTAELRALLAQNELAEASA